MPYDADLFSFCSSVSNSSDVLNKSHWEMQAHFFISLVE